MRLVLLLASFATSVAAIDAQQVLTDKDSPLKVIQHPSTFFEPTKPVYNQYQTYGIHMVLPIGPALKHAHKAIQFANTVKKKAIENEEEMAESAISNNSIITETLPKSTVWSSTMAQMIRIKEDAVKEKINGLTEMVKNNAIPASDFVQAINLHHAAAHHSRHRRRRRTPKTKVAKRAVELNMDLDTIVSGFFQGAFKILDPFQTTKVVKRSIDLNLDLTSAVSAFFNGVSSIFHFKSINEVASSLNNLMVKQTHLREFTQEFATKVMDLMSLINVKEKEDIDSVQTIMSIYMVLDESEKILDTIIEAVTPLLQGVIPSCMATPANLVQLYNQVDSEAKQNGLTIALADSTEILTLTPFTFQRGENFELLLSVPVVNPKNQYDTYRLINLPAIRNGIPTVWDVPSLFFGLRQTLYPTEAEYVAINVEDIHQLCQELFSLFICKIPTLTTPTCISDLYHDLADHCKTRSPTTTAIRMPLSKIHLFFFQNKTDLLIKCDKKFTKIQVRGLVQIEDRENCQLVTEDFSFTFLGQNPQKIFSQAPIKLVNENMMMNISKPVQSRIENSIKNLKAKISDFNKSVEDQEPFQAPSAWNYANLSLSLVALATSVVLVLLFIAKCRHAIPPPGQQPE